jgi:hypothetical protein
MPVVLQEEMELPVLIVLIHLMVMPNLMIVVSVMGLLIM